MSGRDNSWRSLIKKLGHSLDEIRNRALVSILSKLQHGLLSDEDLIQEKHLHICLLEWFNFPSCPSPDKALHLIKRLTKHSSAASIYVDIGGVEFLSQLKENLTDATQRSTVDTILQQLFHLPSQNDVQHSARTCVYSYNDPEPSPHLQSEHTELTPGEVEVQDSSVQAPANLTQLPDPEAGYFNREVDTELIRSSPANPGVSCCFRFAIFPWIALTGTDKHVLSSTDSSLRSSDVSLLISACEFLTDVVFQDFPAEVFLQRPAIVKSLLSLLALPQTEVAIKSTESLHSLSRCLQSRIHYYQDPSLYTPTQDFASSTLNSTPSTLSFADNSGHHGAIQQCATGEVDVNQTIDESDDQTVSRCLQWSVPQFCMAVLDCLLPCLKTTNQRYMQRVIQLLHQVAALLREAVSMEMLWEDHSVAASELVEKFHDWLEMLSDILYLHHHGNTPSSCAVSELRLNRLAYMNVAVFTTELIVTMVPSDKAGQCIKREFTGMLAALAQDECLSYSLPAVRERCLGWLELVDNDVFLTYNLAHHISLSFSQTCAFLLDIQNLDDSLVMSLLEQASDGLPSLPYHLHMSLVTGIIQLASYVCKKMSPNPVSAEQSRTLVLRLLSHPIATVREEAYTMMLSLVKDALGVEHVTEPASSVTASVDFILHHRLMYQMTCFGMSDPSLQVQKACERILVNVLQCQLLVPATRWQAVLEAIAPVMAVLEGHASEETVLGQCIVNLVSTELSHKGQGCLPLIERFRACLRLMMSKHSKLRQEAVDKLAYFLAQEDESINKIPLFSDFDTSKLANLLIINPPRSLLGENSFVSAYTTEALIKVLEIFSSEKTELQARQSSAHQLAIMLQDPDLHAAFKKCGGVDQVILTMKTAVKKTDSDHRESELTCLLPHLLRIMRSVVEHDSSIRHRLSHRIDTYYTVLRGGLLCHADHESRRDMSELLTLLLFDELAFQQTWCLDESHHDGQAVFSLPVFILQHYSLPFTPPSHHQKSPYTVDLSPDPDPLCSGSLAEMLRLSWNVAWHDGIDAVIKSKGTRKDVGEQKFSKKLELTPRDLVIMETSFLPHALQQCVYGLENATSHGDVCRTLGTLSSYVVMACGAAGVPAVDELHVLKWTDTINRFIVTVPSSADDEKLLSQILSFLTDLLLPRVPQHILSWLSSIILNPHGAILMLIDGSEDNEDSTEASRLTHRNLSRHILAFIRCLLAKLPYDVQQSETSRGQLALGLLTYIRGHETVQSYNLPTLEGALQVLMHLTARRGWSMACDDVSSQTLCQQMQQFILEVVVAFHIGRGGVSMSYMGRGVTRCAALCLRHLAAEISFLTHDKAGSDLTSHWMISTEGEQSGLHWLTPLWCYRDPEVRATGLGIAVAITTTQSGKEALISHLGQIHGGAFGTAISLLIDHTETSLVREQAALLLVNLTSETLTSYPVIAAATSDENSTDQSQTLLTGISALLWLLHNKYFYPALSLLLSSFYPQPAIHPLSVTGESFHETALTSSDNSSSAKRSHEKTEPTPLSQHNSALTSVVTSSSEGHRSQDGSSKSQIETTSVNEQGFSVDSQSSLGNCYQQVADPALVSAVCHLLGNLVAIAPQDTLLSINNYNLHKALASLLDAGLLEAYIAELSKTRYKAQFRLAFTNLLACHHDILLLLRRCCAVDGGCRNALLMDSSALKQIVKSLLMSNHKSGCEDDSQFSLEPLHSSCLGVLTVLLSTARHQALTALSPMLINHWPQITTRLCELLSGQVGTTVWLSAVCFIGVLLSEEMKLSPEVSEVKSDDLYLVSDQLNSGHSNSSASGACLCEALMQCLDKVLLKRLDECTADKTAVINSLKVLLAASSAAKTAALQAGLMESLLLHLNTLHQKLTKLSHDVSKISLSKKKNPVVAEIQLIVDLLRNFCHGDQKVKVAAFETGLSQTLHVIWSWCLLDLSLMYSVLALLATYTAHCKQACSSVALTNLESVRGQRGMTNMSLLHAIIKLTQQETAAVTPNISLLRAAFIVIATSALSPECRGVFCKSSLLRDFTTLTEKKCRKTKEMLAVEGLWLDVLVNLTFSTEGQNMTFSIKGGIDYLLEIGKHPSRQKAVTLILRNLTFHSPNIPKLFAYDKVIPYFLARIESSSPEVTCIACSALLSLAHKSNKAKGCLKSTHVLHRIQDAFSSLQNSDATDWNKSSLTKLQGVQTLLQT